jgi:hypothetical protein
MAEEATAAATHVGRRGEAQIVHPAAGFETRANGREERVADQAVVKRGQFAIERGNRSPSPFNTVTSGRNPTHAETFKSP